MTESEGKCKKMGKEKRGRSFIAFTGAAAVLGIAANLAITAIKYQKAKNAKKKGTTSSQLFNFLLNVCLVNKLLKFQDRFTESSSGNLQILQVLWCALIYLHLRFLSQQSKSLLTQTRSIILLRRCLSTRYYRFASLCFSGY